MLIIKSVHLINLHFCAYQDMSWKHFLWVHLLTLVGIWGGLFGKQCSASIAVPKKSYTFSMPKRKSTLQGKISCIHTFRE